MTENTPQTNEQAPLGFDWRDLAKMRARPAQFARMVGVSRQTVSQWIAAGKVTLGADGKLDPAQAARQVIENSDPGRLRARVLRAATVDIGSLRLRIAALETELKGARERIGFLEKFCKSDERQHAYFILMIKARWEALRDLPARELSARLDEIDETAMLISDGIDPIDPDGEGGHDPQALLDIELAINVLDDLRAFDVSEGAGADPFAELS